MKDPLRWGACPGRGGVARERPRGRNRRLLRVSGTLEDLYTLALGHIDPHHPHPVATLRTMTSRPEAVAPIVGEI